MKLILVGLLVAILAVHYSEQAGIHRRSLDADEHHKNEEILKYLIQRTSDDDYDVSNWKKSTPDSDEQKAEGEDDDIKHQNDDSEDDSEEDDAEKLLSDKFRKLEQHLEETSAKLEEHFQRLDQNLEAKYEDLRKTIMESKAKEQRTFVKIGLKYYYIEDTEELNWFEAADSCRQMGANLASPQSEEEFNALNEKLTNSHYWLGINDLGSEGAFKSTVSGQEPEYVNWHQGEPNSYGGDEDCVELRLMGGKHAMNDHGCQKRSHYICEKNYHF